MNRTEENVYHQNECIRKTDESQSIQQRVRQFEIRGHYRAVLRFIGVKMPQQDRFAAKLAIKLLAKATKMVKCSYDKPISPAK